MAVQVSGCPWCASVRVSGCPGVCMSRCPGGPGSPGSPGESRCPGVQVCGCACVGPGVQGVQGVHAVQAVQVCRGPGVQVSKFFFPVPEASPFLLSRRPIFPSQRPFFFPIHDAILFVSSRRQIESAVLNVAPFTRGSKFFLQFVDFSDQLMASSSSMVADSSEKSTCVQSSTKGNSQSFGGTHMPQNLWILAASLAVRLRQINVGKMSEMNSVK